MDSRLARACPSLQFPPRRCLLVGLEDGEVVPRSLVDGAELAADLWGQATACLAAPGWRHAATFAQAN